MRVPRALAVTLAAALAITTAAGSAVAADPPGTITLATGDSAMRYSRAMPVGAVSGGYLFNLADRDEVTLVDAAGKSTTYPTPDLNWLRSCGSTSTVVAGGSDQSVSWFDVASHAGHEVTLAEGRTYLGPAPDGWVEYTSVTDGETGITTVDLYHHLAASGAVALIHSYGELSSYGVPGSYACDGQGFAFVMHDSPQSTLYRQPFSGGDPEVVLPTAENGRVLTWAVAGREVIYSMGAIDTSTGEVYRQAAGSMPEEIASGIDNSAVGFSAAMSATATLFTVDAGSGTQIFSKPIGATAREVTGLPTLNVMPFQVRADPTAGGFLLGSAPDSLDDGSALYDVVGTAATGVWSPPMAAMETLHAESAPGRAVWSDDREVGDAVWSRSITGTGTLLAGPEQLIGTHVSAGVIAVDGRRVVWANDSTNSLVVHDGASAATRGDVGTVMAMSGHRVLRSVNRAISVLDLVTGTSRDATGMQAIWGNRAVGLDSTGAIIGMDLTTGKTSTVVTADQTGITPDDSYLYTVLTDQDLVVWYSLDAVGWRNLRTGEQAEVNAGTGEWINGVSVSGDRIAARFSIPDAAETRVFDPTGKQLVTVAATEGQQIGPVGLVWAARNPNTYRLLNPELTPVPSAGLPPRHEGNPFLPASLDLTATSPQWVGEWVFTEPLTTCSLVIRNGLGTVVRTISCDAAYTPLGEAVVTWDGKDSSGALVPGGSYTWQLAGGDGDGSLVDVDGTSGVQGAVTVTNGTPTPGTLTTSKPTISGSPVVGSTLTANAGSWGPAPVTLTYQWYRDGVAIPNATSSTYAVATADVGARLTVTVTGTKTGYTTAARTSDQTAVVTAPTTPPQPPPAPKVIRIGGADRIATAIAASKLAFPTAGGARAVVLSRHDAFADALAGTPLAGAAKASLLMTRSKSLDASVAAEIKRVLPAKGTVYLLGGTGALSSTIEGTLKSMGFNPVRVAGADRFATSVAIANETAKVLGHRPNMVFATTGMDFPDGLAAGATAGSRGATLVLTQGSTVPTAVRSYLTAADKAGTPLVAVGGPSAKASVAWDQTIVGSDRYATAAQLATVYWAKKGDPADDARAIGIATGQNWPDALSGGAFMAGRGPLLVTTPTSLRPVTKSAIQTIVASETPSTVRTGYVFGGAAVVNNAVLDAVAALLR